MINYLSYLFIVFIFVTTIESQLFQSERDENKVFWCTVNEEEQKKCESIAQYLKDANQVYGNFRSENIFQLECNQVCSKFLQTMKKVSLILLFYFRLQIRMNV